MTMNRRATFNCGHDKDCRHFVAELATTGALASHALVAWFIPKAESRNHRSCVLQNVTGKHLQPESGQAGVRTKESPSEARNEDRSHTAPTEEFTPQNVTVTAHVNALFNLK